MTYVLLALLVLLIVLVNQRRALGSAANVVIPAVAAIAVGLVIFRAASRESPQARATRIEQAFSHACGYVLGGQVADQVVPGPVIVLQHSIAILGEAGRDAELAGVRDGLGDGDWTLEEVAIDLGNAAMVEAVVSGAAEHPLNAAKIRECLRAAPDAVAFISFLGLPPVSPASLQGSVPPFFVLETSQTDFREWWRSGLLGAVAKQELKSTGQKPNPKAPPEELFAYRYRLLTKTP